MRAERRLRTPKKKRALAKSLDVRLGRATGFSEGHDPVRMYAMEGKGGFAASVASPAPEVAPGEQEIQSLVTITYEFR